MKYSQFLEASSILEQKNLNFNNIKHLTLDELNEIFSKPLNEIWGINTFLRSSWLTKYGRLSKRFKKIAITVKADVSSQLNKSIKKYTRIKTQNVKKIENIQSAGRPIPDQLLSYNFKIEQQIMKTVNELADKLINIKTEEVFNRVETKFKKQTTILELKYLWEVLMAEVKLSILNDLMKAKILSSDKIVNSIASAKNKKAKENTLKFKKLKKAHVESESGDKPSGDEGIDLTTTTEL